MKTYDISRSVTPIVFFICCLNIHLVYSQSVITGKIQNAQKEAAPDISVILMQLDSTIVGYAMSDVRGSFRLNYSGDEPHLLLSISAFDVKRQTKKIENRSQNIDFITEEGSIQLQEVLVKSTKIWGTKDTINYLVSAFKDQKDLVIGDVLKKMPGIDVKESGQISYKGKPINKFYIENMDMLQGRYGIATQNISADAISTVQVMENHQPIKALEKTQFSNETAINLRIKDSKKGVFSMMAMLGAGFDKEMLWKEELTGMYFAKSKQRIFTYKTNNNGTDVSKELHSFTGSNSIDGLQMTDVQQPSPPSIRFERYNFNTTHAATANNLFKLKNDDEINANIIFYNNKDRRHSLERTSYVLPGEETQTIVEDISAQNTTNNIEGEFRYNRNKNFNYFNNYLNVSGCWDDATGVVNTSQLVNQRLDNKSFSAHNITHWIKRGENEKGIEMLLKNAYRTQPHRLSITPGLYPDLINGGNAYAALAQDVRYNALLSNNRLSFLSAIVLGNVRINPTANVNVEHQTMRSYMDMAEMNTGVHSRLDADMQNDITWTRIYTALSLDASYNGTKLKIAFSLPVSYGHTHIHNDIKNGSNLSDGKFYFQPSLSARYHFTNKMEVSAGTGFRSQTPGLPLLYTGYIMQNYRSINRYDTRLFDTNIFYTSLGLSYKSILDMFFVSGDMLYSSYRRDGMYGQIFDGLLSETQLTMQHNGGHSISVRGHVSKGFDWKALVLSADVSWGKSISEQMRQNKLVEYESQWTNASASVNLKPFRGLLTEYKISWGRSQGKVDSGETFSPIQSITQRANADISLPFDISLKGSVEHYYNDALQGSRHFLLADLGLTYNRKGVLYSLDWTNIFNTEKFISASYGALNSYYSEYDIRSAAIMLTVRFKLL